MTVRVERTAELAAERERVWAFLVDPGKRAGAISVVSEFELGDDEGRTATWYLDLPIPLLRNAFAVETEDVVRREPEYVKFTGRSRAMNVVGEHELEALDGGTRLTNRFTVEGKLPGVERFFERSLDAELENLRRAIEADLGIEVDG
ncbi:MAG: SRPBCC family protein [Halobacteriales archaeon]|nr:SRPBCC family protein [Halobacteriales archaeon]